VAGVFYYVSGGGGYVGFVMELVVEYVEDLGVFAVCLEPVVVLGLSVLEWVFVL